MARIICGHFDENGKAEAALLAVLGAGFQRTDIDSFYSPPPGQNALHPLGGDVHADAGARKAGPGAAFGAAIGAGVGALLALVAMRIGILPASEWAPIAAVAGAALGAYVGSFIGAMKTMHHGDREPPAGRMVAVLAERGHDEDRAVKALRSAGAKHIWRAEGTWRNGSWLDFDPRSRRVSLA